MKPRSIITTNSISCVIEGQHYSADKTHPNFNLIVNAIKNSEWETALTFFDIPKSINALSEGKCRIDKSANKVFYDNEEVHGVIVERILDFMKAGENFSPLMNFLEKLMANPSRRSIQELYSFLEHGSMPIDEDGYFYAYKGVTHDFKDIRTETFDNRPGQVLEMPRRDVCDDYNNGCSTGFHAGTYKYATGFAGYNGKVVIVKINPADVVSVPHDCSCQKLRTYKYEVVAICDGLMEELIYSN